MTFRIAPLALIGLLAWPAAGDEPPPRPAITIRLARPDREAERVIALFRGSRAADPAQALAAWKRASVEPRRLGKPLEVLIAAINPAMAAELRTLDGAEAVIGFEANFTRAIWFARIPGDDGTFAALATALVLSGGAEEPPIGALGVDRLGPPGAPLMARGPKALVVAGSRRDLESALARPESPKRITDDNAPAVGAEIDPEALAIGGPPPLSWLLRGLVVAGCRTIEANAGISGTAFEMASTVRFRDASLPKAPALDPRWLDLIPRDSAIVAAAFSLDPAAWDAGFALADRVEKQEPGRADVAPLRFRLGLLARAFGVRVEADILPHLRGITAWAGAAPGGPIDRGAIAAHFADESAALRVLDRIRPNDAISFDRRGPTLLIAWGPDAMRASLDAIDQPDRSAGPLLRSGWGDSLPSRAGGAWPGRFLELEPGSSPLAVALAEAPPVVWTGRTEGAGLLDRVRWEGLDATIRRFLDLIPLDPPPDR